MFIMVIRPTNTAILGIIICATQRNNMKSKSNGQVDKVVKLNKTKVSIYTEY